MEFKHVSVLFSESIDELLIKDNGIYIDGTAGGGGHSSAILEKLKGGKLVSIDQDPDAIKVLKEKLSKYDNSILEMGNFSQMEEIAHKNDIYEVDGVLLDIGVSSFQLDETDRGFSYHNDAVLDMRMSKSGVSAKDIVNEKDWKEIAKIISMYGEEKFAVPIAKAIVKNRAEKPIETTVELAEIIKSALPAAVKREGGHPARKTFQALRIEVNDELGNLKRGLKAAFNLLKPGGRLCVITFHSLEDRIVKKQMNEWCISCTCPKEFPICVCGGKAQAKVIYKRGILPSKQEIDENPRARSARLRVLEKL